METRKSGPGAARAGNAPDEQHSLKKTGDSGAGGWKPGNLAQEPPEPEMQPDEQYPLKETSGSGGGLETRKSAPGASEPEMHRMSNILLRKRVVLEQGLETWKSGPGAT